MQPQVGQVLRKIENQRAWEYIILTIITVVAAVLRLYKLGEWSFWWDELYTIRDVNQYLDLDILGRTTFRTLNYLLLPNLEINEWNVRIISAVIGILTIPILYFPIRRIFKNEVALLSTLLLAISPWHIYWSQSSRFYTILLLYYTLALLFFFISIEEDKPLFRGISILFLGLALFEKISSAIIIIVLGAYLSILGVAMFKRPNGYHIKKMLFLFIPGVIVLLFLVPGYLPRIIALNEGWINNNPFWLLSGVIFYIGLPVLSIGSAGALFRLLKKDRAVLLLSLNAVLPIITIAVLSIFMYTANRYAFITLTSWLILAALAVKELIVNSRGLVKLFGLGVMGILILSPLSEDVLYFRYQNGNRDDWKSAFYFIEQHKQVGDLVVSANPDMGNYYLGEQTIGMSTFTPDILQDIRGDVWFVEDFNAEEKWPQIHKWIVENTRLVGVFDVHVQARNFSMRVYHYDNLEP